MSDRSVDDLLAAARQQQQVEQAIGAACQAAVTNPTRLVQINVCAIGVAVEEDGSKTLIIGQPNGELIRVPLAANAVRDIHRATRAPDDNGEPSR